MLVPPATAAVGYDPRKHSPWKHHDKARQRPNKNRANKIHQPRLPNQALPSRPNDNPWPHRPLPSRNPQPLPLDSQIPPILFILASNLPQPLYLLLQVLRLILPGHPTFVDCGGLSDVDGAASGAGMLEERGRDKASWEGAIGTLWDGPQRSVCWKIGQVLG